MGESSIRIGLAGLGRHGARYARHLTRGDVPGAVLSAVWRRDPALGAQAAAELGVRYEPTPAGLASAPDVDAVVCVVPVGTHAEVASQVAAARKPILIEKPLARSAAEGEAIVRAFAEVGAPLMVAQTLRFDPLVVALRETAPALGKLRGFTFEQRLEPRGLAWEDDPIQSGGGVLIQTGIHAVDALRAVTRCERLDVLTCTLGHVPGVNTERHAVLTLVASGGPLVAEPALGTCAASKLGASRHHRFSLFLDDGGLEADFISRTLELRRGRDRTITPMPEAPTIVEVLRAFTSLARGERPNPVPGEDALTSLAVVSRAYEMVR